MNPRHLPKEPWDSSWERREERGWEIQDPLGLPPISWGSPRLAREATYDRLHQLNGTWTGGLGNLGNRGSSFHSLADLENSAVAADLPTTSPGVEPVVHLSSPAVRNRPIVRPGTPSRPSRPTRRRPSDWFGFPSVPIYTSVYDQPQSSPTLWTDRTPVSGGTGLSITPGYPRTVGTTPGVYEEDFAREVGSQLRLEDPAQDITEPPDVKTPRAGCPHVVPTAGCPRSTKTMLTCKPRLEVVWREEEISWTGSSGRTVRFRLKRGTYS